MLPVLRAGDTLLHEAVIGQRLKGEILLVNEGKGRERVEHYCYDENKTHVFLTGLNNRRSDGWYPKMCVMGVLVGVVRIP